jgi:GNAT superfamily N-acetyltransferase
MIRAATQPECSIIRAAWVRTFNPSAGRGDLVDGMLPWGRDRRRISPVIARVMLNAVADKLATPETVIVWDVDGEPLSCLCRDVLESRPGRVPLVAVHFVYTLAAARGRGLASSLLRFAMAEADRLGAELRPTHMTEAGAGLWRSVTDVRQERA